eukprot:1143664-Pelagomonas_calceolata.AAC.4
MGQELRPTWLTRLNSQTAPDWQSGAHNRVLNNFIRLAFAQGSLASGAPAQSSSPTQASSWTAHQN